MEMNQGGGVARGEVIGWEEVRVIGQLWRGLEVMAMRPSRLTGRGRPE